MATPTQLIQLPDVELILTTYLADQLDGVAHVGLIVPAADDIFGYLPFVRVARRAGIGRHFTSFDDPIVDIDCWDTTNAKVNAIGALARAYVAAMRGFVDTDNHAAVTATTEVVGPQRLPEDDSRLVRLGFTVGLTLHRI